MNWLKDVLVAAGAVIDKFAPKYTGSRTAFAGVACSVIGVATAVLPVVGTAVPAAAPITLALGALLPSVQHALCTAIPVFGAANIARKLK